ncbi:MAG: hypothetical protein QXG25_06685, partial [Nitrososphaerota archaeon]
DVEKALSDLAKNGIGVLSYLRSSPETFAGIGLLIDLNTREGIVRILTPYRGQIKEIIVGAILLSVEGEEVYSNPKLLTLSSIS